MTREKRDLSQKSQTVHDVARKAGVSSATVSYVLNENGQRNKHVSDVTRTKVLQAVQELNFYPDTAARNLKKGQSQEIAVILETPLSAYSTELIASLQDRAASYGYTTVVYPTRGFSAEKMRILYETIFARRPIGIFTSAGSFTPEFVALAHQRRISLVIHLNNRVEPFEQTYSILYPSWAMGYLAAQHLLERGHRRLALIEPEQAMHAPAFLQRLEGMRAAIAGDPGVTLDTLSLSFSASEARSRVEKTFVGPERPTGIYTFNDEYAVVLLGALTRIGIRVPQEVALVGTDNITIGELVWPALTTICFDALDIGKRAIEMLHLLHQGLPLSEELTRPLIPQLIQREST